MLLSLTWNNIPIPEGGRLWAGLVPIALGIVAGLWKGRGRLGEMLTSIRSRLAPAPTAGPARESVAAAIVTLAESAKEAHDPAMADAAVKAFQAFARVEPEVKP